MELGCHSPLILHPGDTSHSGQRLDGLVCLCVCVSVCLCVCVSVCLCVCVRVLLCCEHFLFCCLVSSAEAKTKEDNTIWLNTNRQRSRSHLLGVPLCHQIPERRAKNHPPPQACGSRARRKGAASASAYSFFGGRFSKSETERVSCWPLFIYQPNGVSPFWRNALARTHYCFFPFNLGTSKNNLVFGCIWPF